MLNVTAGRKLVADTVDMFNIISFLCFLSVAFAETTQEIPHLDGRIVGGSATSIDKYPYQVSLQYGGSHICGGSIISSQWVLTAAHCMVYSASGYTVRAGTSIRHSGGTVYSVSNVIIHSNYNSRTSDYDIAVIRLSTNITLGPNAQIVNLTKSAPASGASAVVTGWGTTTEGGLAANTLQEVSVPIVSNSACESFYGSGLITDRMVCAGFPAGGKDACQGDSGGPLVVNGEQVGVVSWGYGCARPSYPGVYSNVANLRSWICITGVDVTCSSCIYKSESLLLFFTVLLVLRFNL